MERKEAEAIEQRVEQADELIERIDALLEEDDTERGCDRAVALLLPFLKENPLYASGWLRAAQLAQAGSEQRPLTVDEIELALRWGCFLNEFSSENLTELGHFLLAERSDAPAALASFQTAADLAMEQLEEAYVGMIEALNAQGDTEELKQVIEESRRFFPESEAIQEALGDWQADE